MRTCSTCKWVSGNCCNHPTGVCTHELNENVFYQKWEAKDYKPIIAGDSYGIQHLCSACDFPKEDTLTFDMKYCWNCGAKIDWSDYEVKK